MYVPHINTPNIYMYNAHTYIYKYTCSCRTPRHFLDSLLVRVSINNASRRLTSVWLPVWMSGIGLAVCPYVWLSVRMPVRPSVCLTSVYILLPHTDFPGLGPAFCLFADLQVRLISACCPIRFPGNWTDRFGGIIITSFSIN